MSPDSSLNLCEKSELTCAYAARALSPGEAVAAEAHIASCADCRRELESLRPVVDRLVYWPTDVLRPSTSLQQRLALRIAEDTGKAPVPTPTPQWSEPEWQWVAPGIACKLLAEDAERHRVSMLVRLAPGASYPPHAHAGVEELHLLDGELWINGRKFVPGDYNYGAPGALDESVWSETGCTCVLVTSASDTFRRDVPTNASLLAPRGAQWRNLEYRAGPLRRLLRAGAVSEQSKEQRLTYQVCGSFAFHLHRTSDELDHEIEVGRHFRRQ